ncbi:MAG: FAD-dependent oxidoreductase [Ignavibacteriaceae bacterium]|nr:FAD-dependent oxidoreductase [Ignavibacteriaceae bacterium]
MKQQIEIIVPPEKIHEEGFLRYIASRKLGVNPSDISKIVPVRRSIDARREPIYRILADVYIGETPSEEKPIYVYNPVNKKKKVIVVGFGSSGMFAALHLIELGIMPIVLERGKDVQARRRDLSSLMREQIVNPDSNYCFGEGGAGTYSDGKLYTRAVKRGNVSKILEVFIQHGAHPDIVVDTHPHIGSNKLPKIIAAIRQTVLNAGGEIHYESRVTDFIIKNKKITGVIVNSKEEYLADAVILSAGHSARDMFYLLQKNKIKIEAKPFAMGVRIEHPQPLINEIQYHMKIKPENLPAATYNLSTNIDGAGVYSFCMCPGGIIVPAMTAPDEIVVNGMSMSRRDSPYANSGLVVEIKENEWDNNEVPEFSALKLQQDIEQLSFRLAGSSLSAPAQRANDFVEGKFSQTLPKTSYIPGLTSSRLDEELPLFIVKKLKKALKEFSRRMRGYLSDEAVLVGVESRTSSPIRVPRDRESFMHVEVKGLFPCGEGAGYAGGIVSSALDGENCAEAVSKYL